MSYIDGLVDALKNSDPETSRRVALALMELRDQRVVEPLILAVQEGEYDTRHNAMEVLSRIADERTLDTFINLLDDL